MASVLHVMIDLGEESPLVVKQNEVAKYHWSMTGSMTGSANWAIALGRFDIHHCMTTFMRTDEISSTFIHYYNTLLCNNNSTMLSNLSNVMSIKKRNNGKRTTLADVAQILACHEELKADFNTKYSVERVHARAGTSAIEEYPVHCPYLYRTLKYKDTIRITFLELHWRIWQD
jgi:hypothetical protein